MEQIEKAEVQIRVRHPLGATVTLGLETRYGYNAQTVNQFRMLAPCWDRDVEPPNIQVEVLGVWAEGCSQLELAQAERQLGRLEARDRSLTADLLEARAEAGRLRVGLGAADERIAALEGEVAALQRLLRKGGAAE